MTGFFTRFSMTLFSAVTAILALAPENARAVEGGVETYLLGSRDGFAGILPGPGTYLNNDFVFFSGSAPSIPAGGVAVVNPKLKVFTYKFNITHVFDAKLGNARLGVNVNIPWVSANMDFTGVAGSGLTGSLSDTEKAFSDITVTPLFNWSKNKLHTTLALQFFLPTGRYNLATVNVPARSVNVLNAGKNRFAFDPTLSMTWFDPATGWEISGAFGVTFSAENKDTQYQTAPEAHFEGTVMRHLPNKLSLGLTGYAYHQIGDDSGAGAANFKAQVGASSLQARVFGLGPVLSWSTQIGNAPVSVKMKYISEFGAHRRFESDKFWMTVGLVF